jgi:hypothetical protein
MAYKKLAVQIGLQLLHRRGYGRLRDKAAFGGSAETQLFIHCNKVSQGSKVHEPPTAIPDCGMPILALRNSRANDYSMSSNAWLTLDSRAMFRL